MELSGIYHRLPTMAIDNESCEMTLEAYLIIGPFGSTGDVQLSCIELAVMLLMMKRLIPSGLPDRVEALIVGLLVHLNRMSNLQHFISDKNFLIS